MFGSLLLSYMTRKIHRLLSLFRFRNDRNHNHTTFRTQDTRKDDDADAYRHDPRRNFRYRKRWRLRQHLQRIFRRIRSRLRRGLGPRVLVTLPLLRLLLPGPGLNAVWRISLRFSVFVVIVVVIPVTSIPTLRVRVIFPPSIRILTVRSASVLTCRPRGIPTRRFTIRIRKVRTGAWRASIQATRIGVKNRIVEDVRIEVRIAACKLDRVFADEALEAGRVVPVAQVVETGAIVFTTAVSVLVSRRGAGGTRFTEGLVSVLRLQHSGRVN